MKNTTPKPKPTRGGRRPGSGRKPIDDPAKRKTTSSMSMLPEAWSRLDAAAEREGLARSAFVERWALRLK